MKKVIPILLMLVCLSATAMSQSREEKNIDWQNIVKASQLTENTKPFFIDFYTTWCGWCKRMDGSVFTDPTIIKLLNRYYVPVKFDAEGNVDFVWKGVKYAGTPVPPGGRKALHNFTKTMLGKQLGFPSFAICSADHATMQILQGYQTVEELKVILWYFASGDYNKYSYAKYQTIFEKEIEPKMQAALK